MVGLCFKASIAPFHQWTPDVYEGAPTPVTALMAVTTKVAAFGLLLRFFDVALISAQGSWGPALAALATITILVGNVGALGQSSLKRMLAYSSVGQAGYMLAGVVVATQLGVQATVFYLAVYLFMNMAAFGVIVARERETGLGDRIEAIAGIGRDRPWLAWPLTLAMLGLAGIPATAGFIGKFYLIDAAVSGGYTWLGIVIVVGSMISLGYYLPVIAAVWARPAATGDPAPPSPRPSPPAGGPCPRWPAGHPSSTSSATQMRAVRDPAGGRARRGPRGRRHARSSGSSRSRCSTSCTGPGRRCRALLGEPAGGLRGLFGLAQLALDEVEPGVPEAGVGEIDADDRAELLGRAGAARREHLQIAGHELGALCS